MLQAIEYEILRDVEANGRIAISLAREPVKVATILSEDAFNDGHYLVHNQTVFFEDRIHDWQWRRGEFRYYTRVTTKADVLIVYEVADVVPHNRPFNVRGDSATNPTGKG